MRVKYFPLVLMLGLTPLYSQDIGTLLASYLANDNRMAELVLLRRQAELALKRSQIETGVTLNLSSGTIKMQFDKTGNTYSLEPQMSLAIPALNGTTISAVFPVDIDSRADQTVSIDGSSLSLSAGIVSGERDMRKITLLEKERALSEAAEALERRALEGEAEFYTALRTIYEQKNILLTLRNDYLDELLEFEAVKVQGYGKQSPLYRTAEMEARSAERDTREAERLLERLIKDFFDDCGIVTSNPVLPEDIPSLNIDELPDMKDYNGLQVYEIEKASWTHYINEMTRKAEKSWTLNADLGFTYNGMKLGHSSLETENSIDGALTFGWRGISLSAGTSVPLSSGTTPGLTFNLGWKTSEFMLKPISDEEKILASKIENIAIKDAEKTWNEKVQDGVVKKNDLKWSLAERTEQYKLYSELEHDMQEWYKAGVVSETQLRQAQTNKEKYFAECMLLNIDVIILKTEILLNLKSTNTLKWN